MYVDQARIYQFMKREKENKSSHLAPVEQSGKLTEENGEMEQKQSRLRKRVAGLMKKQKKLQAMGIIGRQDDWKTWGQEAQVKVCNDCICTNEQGKFLLFVLQCIYVFIVNTRLVLD